MELRKAYSRLRRRVLDEADDFVTTTAMASCPKTHSFFKPRVVITDEAARTPELQAMPTCVNYCYAQHLHIGDPVQLPPHLESTSRHFWSAERTALFTRLRFDGHTMAKLTTQLRSTRTAVDAVFQIFYQGSLITTIRANSQPGSNQFCAVVHELVGGYC